MFEIGVMAPSVSLWLFLPLLFSDAKSAGQRDGLDKPSSHVKLEPLWTSKQPGTQKAPDQSLPLPEMLDLDQDQQRRLARGADEDEQQSTFSQSYENDSVTTPQATEFYNSTKIAAGVGGNDENDDINHHVNISSSDHEAPGLFNPFYPLAESSYAAYAILFLAGLVLAVGVVGNMAVMCIVWNNYYMRSAWNYLLASMAFWDFLVLVLCLPVVVLNQLSHRRILGDITCRMVPYMEVGGAYGEVGGSQCALLKVFLCELSCGGRQRSVHVTGQSSEEHEGSEYVSVSLKNRWLTSCGKCVSVV